MKKSIPVKPKRGRPPTGGRDPFVGVRLPETLIAEIDAWSVGNDAASRSEAIRRLVEIGLGKPAPAARPSASRTATAAKAKELAAKAIDRRVDPTAPAEEKASRKHRLLKGPEEFREVRVDRVKPK
jgi:Arc/MetJ-type ribon-helix-helix transcriptional regulator